MRFTVTPLGGGRADTARVVDAIVRYLQPPAQPTPLAGPNPTPGPERYYADHGEEPGRWIGTAATTAGLAGDVQRDDLAAVLAGRHPHTGERLVTAQGSAARRPTLGAGTHTRTAANGEGLLSLTDAAAALGLTRRDVQDLIASGRSQPPAEDPAGHPARHPDDRFLTTHTEPDGTEWIRHT